MGGFRHAAPGTVLTAIGAVLSAAAIARQSDDEITIFDNSGIWLQDIFIAKIIPEITSAADADG